MREASQAALAARAAAAVRVDRAALSPQALRALALHVGNSAVLRCMERCRDLVPPERLPQDFPEDLQELPEEDLPQTGPALPAAEALDALEIPYARRGAEFYYEAGIAPAVLRCGKGRYALYARVAPGGCAARCNEINRMLGDGCLVLAQDGYAVLKQTIYIEDDWGALWALKAALRRQEALVGQALKALTETP